MNHPIRGTCDGCGRGMVSEYAWRRMTETERAELRALNLRPKAKDGECRPCKEVRKRAEQRALIPSTSRYERAELLEEWNQMVDHSESLHANCRRIGPRLGMRPKSLEKALNRAGINAWPTDVLGWAERREAS